MVFHKDDGNTIYQGSCVDVLKSLPADSVDCCVTSPPYWGLRDYDNDEQIGWEEHPKDYVKKLVKVFREVHRVLKPQGTLWLNLGDSYIGGNWRWGGDKGVSKKQIGNRGSKAIFENKAKPQPPEGFKTKDLAGIPWRVALALQEDGWYLRSDIIWNKPNCMPEPIKDRPTKAHEYIFLLAKSERYFYDADAIKEERVDLNKNVSGYKNKRSIWNVPIKPFKGAHFATFPEALIEPCILAGVPHGGTVLDPFFGAGTVGVVAKNLGRNYTGIELNAEYCEIAKKRLDFSIINFT